MKTKFLIGYLIILAFTFAHAQTLKDELVSLEKNFKEFKYEIVIEKGKFLLGDRFTTQSDSLQIYQYILSSAYALNDTLLAKQVIADIIDVKPGFTLHPQETSPKIIQFFNHVKNELDKQKNILPDSLSELQHVQQNEPAEYLEISAGQAIASVMLPGSGHILSGNTNRGYFLSSVSLALIGTNIYLIAQTSDYRTKYINLKKNNTDFNERYDKYNTAYKLRNSMFVIYGLWNLFCFYDLHHTRNFHFGLTATQDNFRFSLAYQF